MNYKEKFEPSINLSIGYIDYLRQEVYELEQDNKEYHEAFIEIARIAKEIIESEYQSDIKVNTILRIITRVEGKIMALPKISNEDNIDSNKDKKYFEELELTKTEVADWIRKLIPYLENPVILAPEGCFREQQEIKPGAIIQYDPTLLAREPEIINQTENLKILVGLYTSLDDYTEEDEND